MLQIEDIVLKVTAATEVVAMVNAIESYAAKCQDIVFKVTAVIGSMVHSLESSAPKF